MTRWADGPLLGFDVETTGTDVTTARIVTASVLIVRPAEALDERRQVKTFGWLINPGVNIPPEATAIHGITDMQAQKGEAPISALAAIAGMLHGAKQSGAPVIVYNASFDLTLLGYELARYDLPPLDIGHVVDPFVIDRRVDKYRKGSRKLVDVAKHYGVELGDDAHGAEADARATVRLAWKLAARFPALVGEVSLAELHETQIEWQADWAAGFEAYLAKQGKPEHIDGAWPLRTTAHTERAVA